MRADLPLGTVTFLFTDIEGSTRLLHELGAEAYAAELAQHREVLRAAFADNGGVEVDTQGDALFVAFPTAGGAIAAARRATDELAAGRIRVRMGVHTGTPHRAEEGYVGVDVHRAARIAAAGHGGQVLVSSSTAALVDLDELTDLGPHRFKDLAAPERVFQLGRETFPPLKSLYATNLPIPATAFIGRQSEVAVVVDLLGRPDVRLLTLTGPGGAGKSRLALQAAGESADGYPDGIWWVELADLREPNLVTGTVATVIGARDDLASHIGPRRMLIALDNAEHLLDGVVDVMAVRTRCPHVQFLVTSRAPLGIAGEHEFAVAPMSPGEAADLFLDRSAALGAPPADPAAVAAICARLDHLPLAIELAAARTRLLAPTELLKRLDDRLALLTGGPRDHPARMRTLRATIDWSHDLLDQDAQALFRRLSVFRTWAIDDAEAAVGLDLDVLGSLVEMNLVRRGPDRFWMLETIREYAAERLDASGEAAEIRARHARHYHSRAIDLERALARGTAAGVLRNAEADVDNLRASIEYSIAMGNTQAVLEAVAALSNFWDMSGRLLEGYERTVAALEADTSRTSVRSRALFAAANLAAGRGDLAAAARMTNEGLELSRVLADPVGQALGLAQMGYHAAEAGRWAAARGLLEESIELFRRTGEHVEAMYTTRTLAWVCNELGDRARAIALSEANLAEARARGDEVVQATTLGAMTTMFTLPAGDLDAAREHLRSAMEIWVGLGDLIAQTVELGRWADLVMARGDHELSARLLAAAVTARSELSAGEQWVERDNEGRRRALEERLGAERFAAAWRDGSGLSLEAAVGLALDS